MKRYWGLDLSPWQVYDWEMKEDLWASGERAYVCENIAPGLGKSTGLVGFASKLIVVDRSTRGLFISASRSLTRREVWRQRSGSIR